jgi:hypothetical protein
MGAFYALRLKLRAYARRGTDVFTQHVYEPWHSLGATRPESKAVSQVSGQTFAMR